MITFNLIREDIAPTVIEIDTFTFVSGEKRTFAIQLINSYDLNPHFIPALFTASMSFPTADPDTPTVKALTPDSTDRSIATVVLTAAETALLITGTLILTVVEDADATNVLSTIKKRIFVRNRSDC